MGTRTLSTLVVDQSCSMVNFGDFSPLFIKRGNGINFMMWPYFDNFLGSVTVGDFLPRVEKV